MGWTNQAFYLLIVSSQAGTFTGVFVYSPGPGPGNLIFNVAAGEGTDPFGNYIAQGGASQFGATASDTTPTEVAALATGQLKLWDQVFPPSHPGGMSVLAATASHMSVQVTSGQETTEATADLVLASGTQSQLTSTANLATLSSLVQALLSAAASPTAATAALLELQGTLALKDETAPTSVSGNAQPFGNSGSLNNVNGADGNTYDTERLSVPIAAASYSNTSGSPATIASASVGNGGQYDIETWFLYKGGVAAGTPQVIVTGPAESSSMLGINFFGNALASVQTGAMTYGSASTGPTFQTAFGMVRISGLVTFSAAGTLELQIYTSSASDDFIVGGGVLRLMPIAA